jgi:hypothetical protein
MAIAKGTKVEQVLPAPITGTVVEYDVNRESGHVMVKVEWEDAAGVHSRYFQESELKVLE